MVVKPVRRARERGEGGSPATRKGKKRDSTSDRKGKKEKFPVIFYRIWCKKGTGNGGLASFRFRGR